MPPRKGPVLGKAVKALVLAFPTSSSGFPALPLDILFEIFSHLHPLDLLHLTRTTKSFRRFLLNRANAAIWRSAFANSTNEGGPPERPPYMTEPAWARVAFEKTCHVCFAALRDKADLDSVWWEFGARYCGGCLGSQVSSTISIKLKRLDPERRNWDSIFPRVPRGQWGQRWYYLVAHQREMIDAFTETEDEEIRDALVQSRAAQTALVMQHSQLCRTWAKQQIERYRKHVEDRRQEAANRRHAKEVKQRAIKQTRLEAIVEKLKESGWADEPWMIAGSLQIQIQHYPSVDIPQPLARRGYRELEPPLLLRLNAEKRAAILRQRIKVFWATFPLIADNAELNNPAFSLPPRTIDISLIPAVRALLEQEGDAPVSPHHLMNTLRPIMPGLLAKWVEEAQGRTSLHARELLNLEGENKNAPDPLSLAIAYVNCPNPNCGTSGYFPNLYKHPCILHSPQRYAPFVAPDKPDKIEVSYEELVEKESYQKPFIPTMVRFGRGLRGLEGVVRAYGRDPKTATFEQMTIERRLVSCSLCRERSPNMDWLMAMEHCTKFHNRERDPEIIWKLSGEERDSDVPLQF